MNHTRYKIGLACTAAILLAACTSDEETGIKSEGSVVYPELQFGVGNMVMSTETRAAGPMSPDV